MARRTEQLFPLYRIVEWRDGSVFRTEPAGERWFPLGMVNPGQEIEPGLRVGTPDEFTIRHITTD